MFFSLWFGDRTVSFVDGTLHPSNHFLSQMSIYDSAQARILMSSDSMFGSTCLVVDDSSRRVSPDSAVWDTF